MTDKELDLDLIRRTVAKKCSDDDFAVFIHQVRRLRLDPLARQIYCQHRWNKKQSCHVMSIQTSIDGFRLIAERTNHYAGQLGPFWCGQDREWMDVWVEKTPPTAAKVAALRDDFKEPLWSVARFDAYADKRDNKPQQMWATMPDLMIAKCAEALALRRAFPQELSGLYTGDEMQQAGEPEQPATEDEPVYKLAQPPAEPERPSVEPEPKHTTGPAWKRNTAGLFVCEGDSTTIESMRSLLQALYKYFNSSASAEAKLQAQHDNAHLIALLPEAGRAKIQELLISLDERPVT